MNKENGKLDIEKSGKKLRVIVESQHWAVRQLQ